MTRARHSRASTRFIALAALLMGMVFALLSGCGADADAPADEAAATEDSQPGTDTESTESTPTEQDEEGDETDDGPPPRRPKVGEPIVLPFPGRVQAIEFSSDGRLFATAGGDALAVVRETATGDEVARLTRFHRRKSERPSIFPRLSFSPDSAYLAFTASGQEVIIFDLATEGLWLNNLSMPAAVSPILYGQDGRTIVTGAGFGAMAIWDIESAEQILTFGEHTHHISDIASSPDGSLIATASLDATAVIWDAETGAQLTVLSDFMWPVVDVAFSPDGSRLATAGGDGPQIWDVETGEKVAGTDEDLPGSVGGAFNPDGTMVFAWFEDVIIADAETVDTIDRWGTGQSVTELAVSPDGSRVITASEADRATLWDVEEQSIIAEFSDHHSAVTAVAYSPDGTQIAIGGQGDDVIFVYEAATGHQLAEIEVERLGHVLALAYAADGRTLVASSNGWHTVSVLDVETGETLAQFDAEETYSRDVALSPDGRRLLTANIDGTIVVRDLNAGTVLMTLEGHVNNANGATGVAVSPDGASAVTVGSEGRIIAWDLETGQEIRRYETIEAFSPAIPDVAYSPDGRQIAVAGRTVQTFDVETGELLRSWENLWAEHVAFSPDSTKLGIAGLEGLAMIADLERRTEEVLTGHGSMVLAMEFSPDGTHVVTGGLAYPTALLHLLED